RVILGHLAPHLAYAIYHVGVGQQNLDRLETGKKRAKDIGAAANVAVWTLDMDLNLISQNMEGAKLIEKWSVKNRSSGKSSFVSLLPKQVGKMLGAIVLRWSGLRKDGMNNSSNAQDAIVKSGGESYMFTCSILTSGSKGASRYTLVLSAKVMAKREKKPSSGGSYDFTPREGDITTLVAQGYKNSEIAEKLFIAADTVKGHLKSIYSKTGVKSRTGLISKLFISLTEY
ncbi:MAG TPA: response regulator transcription factor, partial [Nitrospirae bacterium]|nr:response regulator transcription factor [Nitrospirota bacterium]